MFHNNNILDEEYSDNESVEYEYDSNPISGNMTNINTNTYLYHNRHNNTPHTNDANANDTNNINNINDTNDLNELIPERIRLLLDRFSINPNNPPSPANNKLIQSIPEIIIDNHNVSNYIMECSICKIALQINNKIKILQCKHYFHSKCIITWLNIHASCPLCRYFLPKTKNNNNNNNNNEDRLHDLRLRRRSRRTLRTQTPSNSNSGNRTPIANATMAATQLITAVTQILNQYTSSAATRHAQRRRRRTRTRTPHSSRSNTITRNSLPELPLLSATSLSPTHIKNNSSPQKINIMQCNVNEDDNYQNNDQNNDQNQNNNDDIDTIDSGHATADIPISASKIQREFCKWNTKRRRSRLDNNNNNQNGPTIIYNSNYNKNYIYNNNYSCDDDDKKMYIKSNTTTPSPAPPRNNNNNNNNNNNKLPPHNTQLGTEFSNQTMIIKNGTFSEQTTPIEEYLLNVSNETTPMPILNDKSKDNNNNNTNHNMYSLMSSEQLENAKKGHKNIINKHLQIVEQIQAEKNKRMLHSFWKCPECTINPRAYFFLPCQHLGLCQKCNLQKINKIMKCGTCNNTIRQKIPINFSH